MSASSAGSQDITARLRKWTHAVDAPPASDLMDEAAREIGMLRMVAESAARVFLLLIAAGCALFVGTVTLTMVLLP